MPFTLAHPAAVLPLRRQRLLPFVPLVVGSMMPDVLYFFPDWWATHFPSAHSFAGTFIVCLPAGLTTVALLLWLRRPFAMLMPAPHRQFLLTCSNWSPRARLADAARLLMALEAGICSHLAWDELTHRNRWLVRHVAQLRAPVLTMGGRSIELFRALQYLSSAAGLLLLAFCYVRALRQSGCTYGEDGERWRWLLLFGISAAASVAAWVEYIRVRGHVDAHPLYETVTTSVATFTLAYVIAAVVMATRLRSAGAGPAGKKE